jgi:ribosomal subunit interface protein
MTALRISGQNMDVGESLRSQVEARVGTALAKYFDGGYTGHVTVAREGGGFRSDCVLHLASGVTLEASGTAPNAYASFDEAADRIEKRLRRYKRRLKDRPGADGSGGGGGGSGLSAPYAVLSTPDLETGDEGEDAHPVVVAEASKPLHRMALAAAVSELDLTGAPALLFIHAGSGRLNLVYRRRDGAIGWVDPPVGPS